MTEKRNIIYRQIWSVIKYVFVQIWIVVLISGIPILIVYRIFNDKYFVRKFRVKYPSKRFLIINKNDPNYLKAYNETLEKLIGIDSVVLNEVDLEKLEYKLEKRIYTSGLSWKNYSPTLIHIDVAINRIGLYYAFKDYMKGKRKKINKIFKKINEIDKKNNSTQSSKLPR